MIRLSALVAVAFTGIAALPGVFLAQGPTANGLEVLQLMHDTYRGKWYASLTFTQQTTARGPDSAETVTTWYESVRYTKAHGTQLRIDIGDPAAGNGVLYSADSVWVMRAGKLTESRKGGNALLPLIEGVYMQPVARTAAELAPTGVDLERRVVTRRWHERPVWIIGVISAEDTTSPQFWVEMRHQVVVRAIFAPVPGRPVMDMRFDGVEPAGGGWLATKCTFYVGGALVQTEEYQDWKANVELPAALFDISQWTTTPHWATKARAP